MNKINQHTGLLYLCLLLAWAVSGVISMISPYNLSQSHLPLRCTHEILYQRKHTQSLGCLCDYKVLSEADDQFLRTAFRKQLGSSQDVYQNQVSTVLLKTMSSSVKCPSAFRFTISELLYVVKAASRDVFWHIWA